MATLYELTEDLLQLYELAQDPESDPQAINDTLEGLDWEFETKAEGYAKLIKQLDADAAVVDMELKRLKARKDALTNNSKRLKERLQAAMELTGKPKFSTELFRFTLRNNPPAVMLDMEVKYLPQLFLKKQEPEADKTAIKEYLAGLPEGAVSPYAHLERSRSLLIK